MGSSASGWPTGVRRAPRPSTLLIPLGGLKGVAATLAAYYHRDDAKKIRVKGKEIHVDGFSAKDLERILKSISEDRDQFPPHVGAD